MTAAATPGFVVDADAHVRDVHIDQPPDAWRRLAELHPGWIGRGSSGGRNVTLVDGKLFPRQEGPGRGVPIDTATSPACEAGNRDLDARISDMDAEGIDVQVLFGALAMAVTTFSDIGFATDFAQVYNDWIFTDVCARHPRRLRGSACVPLQDVDRAIAELQRASRLGAVCVTVPPAMGETTNLDDPRFIPFFEACAEAGVAVGVHSAPGMNLPLPAAGRFSNYAQVHCLSFPVDQMVAFVALTMGGVLDRVPRMRVVFLESGAGWVPYMVDRVHEHREKRAELLPEMRTEPAEYLDRGQCFFAFECEEGMLGPYVERLGDRSLVYSSDYPHWDSDFPGTVEKVRRDNAMLGESALTRILGANAARLYGLEVPAEV